MGAALNYRRREKSLSAGGHDYRTVALIAFAAALIGGAVVTYVGVRRPSSNVLSENWEDTRRNVTVLWVAEANGRNVRALVCPRRLADGQPPETQNRRRDIYYVGKLVDFPDGRNVAVVTTAGGIEYHEIPLRMADSEFTGEEVLDALAESNRLPEWLATNQGKAD